MSDSGIGFAGALFLLFLGLKLGGVIDWSYWWVFAPLWIGAALLLLAVSGYALWHLIIIMRNNRRTYKRLKKKYL